MTLWEIVRFTTIRNLRLTEIYVRTGRRTKKTIREQWVAVKQRNAVMWDPNLLHQFLTGGGVQQDQP